MIVKSYLSDDPQNPKILITSGWHGDEPTGIIFLGTYDFKQYTNRLNIVTVNRINEYGCSKQYRCDKNGLSPDDGFVVREGYQKTMSVESKNIKATEGAFSKFDLHVAIHNDPHREGYYLYTWGDCKEIEKISDGYYNEMKLNKTFDTEHDVQDGSYYDYMYSKYGQKSIIIELGSHNIHNNDHLIKQLMSKILKSL